MKKHNKNAFTFVEMMVVVTILSVMFIGIITGSLQIGKNLDRTRNLITARNEIAVFSQTLYVFTNKSYGAYFTDSSGDFIDYIATYKEYQADETKKLNYNILCFEANSDNTQTGQLIYHPDTRIISWVSKNGKSQEMLTEVYPPDYKDDSNIGSAPIFKLPHLNKLYDESASPDRPRFIVIEFTKVVDSPNITKKLTIPVKLMLQIGIVK